MSDDQHPARQHNEMELADIWNLRRYHQAIRERIGQELQLAYLPPEDLPHRLLALLLQLTDSIVQNDRCRTALKESPNPPAHAGVMAESTARSVLAPRERV